MKPMLDMLAGWLLRHGVIIVLILLGAWIAFKVLGFAIGKFGQRLEQEGDVPSEREKRAKTLSGIIHASVTVFIYAAAGMMLLTECGVSIGPLLAGAGIASLAIGFGAQTLVKDVISGFFILMENQLRVGDVVNIAGVGGLVEAVNLRTTRLRDLEGRVHIVPNGLIEVATNFTKDWSRALIEIGVAYKEDVDQVIQVLQQAGESMQKDPAFSRVILEPLTILGLDSFGESSVNLRMYFKTVPIKQWDVAREFRKRVKKTFDERGIEIPFPHRTIYVSDAGAKGKPPLAVLSEQAPKK